MSQRGPALANWPLQRMNTSCIVRKKSEDGEFLGEDRYLVWTGEGGSEGKGGTTSHQTSHVLEEVPMERESLIITLLAEDFRERALLLTTRSAMFDQISVTNFEQSICFLSRWHFVHHFCGKILKKGLLWVGACSKLLKITTAMETVDTWPRSFEVKHEKVPRGK